MEPASQESRSSEGTVCFQMDCGNPHLSFGLLVARQRPRPSTPVSPDMCIQRADLTSPQPPRVPTRADSGGPRGPPLLSRNVSGSAGWRSSSHWPSVGTRLRPQNEGLEAEQNQTHGPCVCVWWGDVSRRVRPTLPPQLGVKGRGGGERPHKGATLPRVSTVVNPVMREAG